MGRVRLQVVTSGSGTAVHAKNREKSYTANMPSSCSAQELEASSVVDAPPLPSLVVCSAASRRASDVVGIKNFEKKKRSLLSLAKHGKQGYGGPFAFAEAGGVTHASVRPSSASTEAVS